MRKGRLAYPGTNFRSEVDLFLPLEGYGENIINAVNYLKSDWTLVSTDPPVPGEQTNYDQEFLNFEGDAPLQTKFTTNVQVSTGTEYSLSKSFDVSVNGTMAVSYSHIEG